MPNYFTEGSNRKMIKILTILTLLTIQVYGEDTTDECGRVYYWPVGFCQSEGSGSFKIESCSDNAYSVNFYEEALCAGDSQTIIIDSNTEQYEICEQTGACVCASGDNCNVFDWETTITCGTDEATEGVFELTQAIVLDECIAVPFDWDDFENYYFKIKCNDDFDFDEEKFDPNDIPVIIYAYTNELCSGDAEWSTEGFFKDLYDDDSDGNGGDDSGNIDTSSTSTVIKDDEDYGCQYMDITECDYKQGDGTPCSHFIHTPIGECATYVDYYSWGYDDSTSSVVVVNDKNRRRRRLYDDYGAYGLKYTCVATDGGSFKYSKVEYGSNDCSGDVTQEYDVTDECKDDNGDFVEGLCYCNSPDENNEGTSNGCDILKSGWREECNNGNDAYEQYHLVVDKQCIENEQYMCIANGDYSYVERRPYTDSVCDTPQWPRCFYDYSVDCAFNSVTDDSNCGFVTYNGIVPLDTCFSRSSTSTYTDDDGTETTYSDLYSNMYTCSTTQVDDGTGNMVDTTTYTSYQYSTEDCSGDISYQYTIYDCENEDVDCYCGSGDQCNTAQKIETTYCEDGSYSDTYTRFYLLGQCQVDDEYWSGYYVKKTCDDTEGLKTIIYESDDTQNCATEREECSDYGDNDYYDDTHQTTYTCNDEYQDDTNYVCGYVGGYPLDVCASGWMGNGDISSYRYYCERDNDDTVTYWVDVFDTYDCDITDVDPVDTYNATNECAYSDYYDKQWCYCPPEGTGASMCSTIKYEHDDMCLETKDYHTEVIGECQTWSYEDDNGSYKPHCTDDGQSIEYTYYSDNFCQIEETWDDSTVVDSSNWDSEHVCSIDFVFENDCGQVNTFNASKASYTNIVTSILFVFAVLLFLFC